MVGNTVDDFFISFLVSYIFYNDAIFDSRISSHKNFKFSICLDEISPVMAMMNNVMEMSD
jgi:hypothetical protein